jgi:monovalent cation/hydrogen antiporter
VAPSRNRKLTAVSFGAHEDLQLLALLAALAALFALAPTLRIPVPVLLVAGGVALSFIPGLPTIVLPPDIVLVAFLPPLLYSAAFFTSLRDLRSNLRPISLLAFGLVGATMTGVAVVAHAWLGLSWPAAFTLGAIVSPTDALAVTEIAGRVALPHRIVAILEGESLLNDGTALVLYKAAVGAAIGSGFSLLDTSGRLVLNVVGGIAFGLGVGYVVRQVRRRIEDPPIEIGLAVLTGYLAFLPAAAIGVSGVLAAVTAGVYMGWYTPELTNVETRLTGNAFWEILTFLVNATLFVLVGLQLRPITDSLSGSRNFVADAVLICAAVIVLRLVWVPIFTYVPRFLFRRIRERDPYPPWQAPAIISWSGIRGGVSLAAALALPTGFPDRDLIVFVTFCVIVVTLVGQGMTLPSLINAIKLPPDDGGAAREDAKARIKAAEAALARLEELEAEGVVLPESAERLRGAYGFRVNRFRERLDGGGNGEIEERSARYQRARRELLDAERGAVVSLRNAGLIDDEVMNRVQRDIDLEASRLDVQPG